MPEGQIDRRPPANRFHREPERSYTLQASDYVTCQIADQNIFVMRGKDGTLRGFYNVCSHRAHELLRGSGTAKVIVCPYHAWSYHSDGRLRTARGSEKMA